VSRTLLLARTFFGRFFETDLMPPGLPQVQLVIWSMAFLASPGLLLPIRFADKYLKLQSDGPALTSALLVDRLLFITLTMTAIGLVALVIWDGVFPDRRDARILTALPVPGRILIAARILALGALCGIFLAGINAIPTVLYGSLVARYTGINLVRGALAHLVATTLSGLFVFTSLVALQGLILNVGGRRAAERLSVLLQILFVVALLQMIFFMPRLAANLPLDLGGDWLYAIPSVWFLGLYDTVGGRPADGAPSLAGVAVLATCVSSAAATGLFVLTHARLTKRALESRDVARPNLTSVFRGLTSRICSRPESRAVCDFTMRTLVRSRSHRLMLSTYVGIALALVASAIVPSAIRGGLTAFAIPGVEVLSAPVVLGFFLLVGMRVAMAIPIEPPAKWIFRLSEPAGRMSAINGVLAAMWLVGVIPTSLLAAGTAAAMWGVWPAVVHGTTALMMAWMLAEILLVNFTKIPFTCTYFPGKSRFAMLWPLYLTAFITYSYKMPAFEQLMIQRAELLGYFVMVTGTLIAALYILRRRTLSSIQGFHFDEEAPNTVFEGFHLSEGVAAKVLGSEKREGLIPHVAARDSESAP
jgi:hypothetical protein